MFEQIEQLEGRVEALMTLLEEAGQRVDELQRENRRIQHERPRQGHHRRNDVPQGTFTWRNPSIPVS